MSVFDPEDGFIESFPFADGYYGWVWNGAMVDGSRIHRVPHQQTFSLWLG